MPMLRVIARLFREYNEDSIESQTPHWSRTLFHAFAGLALLAYGILCIASQRAFIPGVANRVLSGGTPGGLRVDGTDAAILGSAIIALASAYLSSAVLPYVPVTWRIAQPMTLLSLMAFLPLAIWFLFRFFANFL